MLKGDRNSSISWYLLPAVVAISIVISHSQDKILLKFIGFGGCKCNGKIKNRIWDSKTFHPTEDEESLFKIYIPHFHVSFKSVSNA